MTNQNPQIYVAEQVAFMLKILPICVGIYAVIIFTSLAMIFKKEGHQPWAAFVPFLQLHILAKIIQKPFYWTIIWSGPMILWIIDSLLKQNIQEGIFGTLVFYISSIYLFFGFKSLSKKYERHTLFAFGLIFLSPIFFPILAMTPKPVRRTKKENQPITREDPKT